MLSNQGYGRLELWFRDNIFAIIARRPVGIVTLKNRTISPVAQLFIDRAREVAKPLAKGK